MAIVKWILLCILALAIGGIWVIAAIANFAHGWQWAGNSPWAAHIAWASVVSDVMKAAVFLGVLAACSERNYLAATFLILLWVPCTAWSAYSVTAFAASVQADTIAGRTLHSKADDSVLKQIADQSAQVIKLQDRKLNAKTADWDRIEQEIVRTEARIDKLRAQAKGTTQVVGSSYAVGDMLNRQLGIDAEKVKFAQVIIFVLLVELGSNLSVMAFKPLFGKTRQELGAAPVSVILPLAAATPATHHVQEEVAGVTSDMAQARALVTRLEYRYGPGKTVERGQAFKAYEELCAQEGWKPMTRPMLGHKLQLLGVAKTTGANFAYVLPGGGGSQRAGAGSLG